MHKLARSGPLFGVVITSLTGGVGVGVGVGVVFTPDGPLINCIIGNVREKLAINLKMCSYY